MKSVLNQKQSTVYCFLDSVASAKQNIFSLGATPCSPAIPALPPQPAVLLTEHKMKKVSQLYICGLQGSFSQLQKLSAFILLVSCNPPARPIHQCAAPLMSTAFLKTHLHCSDSLSRSFAASVLIHLPRPLFSTQREERGVNKVREQLSQSGNSPPHSVGNTTFRYQQKKHYDKWSSREEHSFAYKESGSHYNL